MTLPEYSRLKQLIIMSVGSYEKHNDLLKCLKEQFKEGINSVRRFEQINSIGQLLRVLELRGLLCEDDVGPLKEIVQKINDQDLLDKLHTYESLHVPREYANYYANRNTEKLLPSNHLVNSSKSFNENMSGKMEDRIFLTVTEQIGSSWKDLARSLKIQEWRIDDIDNSNITLVTKAYKMLELSKNRGDNKWHLKLLGALEHIRRKDVRDSVQEVMLMNL